MGLKASFWPRTSFPQICIIYIFFCLDSSNLHLASDTFWQEVRLFSPFRPSMDPLHDSNNGPGAVTWSPRLLSCTQTGLGRMAPSFSNIARAWKSAARASERRQDSWVYPAVLKCQCRAVAAPSAILLFQQRRRRAEWKKVRFAKGHILSDEWLSFHVRILKVMHLNINV